MTFDEILLTRIVSDDETRGTMRKVQHEDGNVIATNAHVLVVAPNTYSTLEIIFIEGYPNYKRVIPIHDRTENFKISVDAAKSVFSNLNKIPEYKDCKTCAGTGTEYCDHCEHEHDCDRCGGNGQSTTIEKYIFEPYKYVISINNVPYDPSVFECPILLADALGIKELECCANATNNEGVFYLNDVMVLMMPIRGTAEHAEREVHTLETYR